MHIRLLAVGDRQPSWVDDAFGIYTGRFPRAWKFRLDTIATVRRNKNDTSRHALLQETELILGKLDAKEQAVLLDEHGEHLSSTRLAACLADWQSDGRDLCFIIGGADGVAEACRQRADFTWSLSRLTLAHGLARVVFAEQLYRASSLHAGHPYHRA